MSEERATRPPEIPGFTYVRELGHGGFADVYLYHQLQPSRQVAIKVLHAEMAGSEAAARLAKEADATAGLSRHPHIVTVFQSGVAADGRPFLVMEYYPGHALSKDLRRSAKSLAYSLRTGIQLAGAVQSAHQVQLPDGLSFTGPGQDGRPGAPGSASQGILHRDIKPANILVDAQGNRPVLGDFGIAMSAAEAQLGGAEGLSVPWSPPEAFGQDSRPSRQSDVWSLAATVYALLSGHAPFEIPGGDNRPFVMIDRICHEPYRPLTRVDAPPSLNQVLATAMAKSPQARYASMTEFAMALRAVEAELGLPPTPWDVLDDSVPDDRTELGHEGTRLAPFQRIDPSGQSESTQAAPTSWPDHGVHASPPATAPAGLPAPPPPSSATLTAPSGEPVVSATAVQGDPVVSDSPDGGPAADAPSTGRPGPGPGASDGVTTYRPLSPAPPTSLGVSSPAADGVTRYKPLQPVVPPAVASPGGAGAGPRPAGPPAAQRRVPWAAVASGAAVVVVAALIVVLVKTGGAEAPTSETASAVVSPAPQNPIGASIPPAPVDITGTWDEARRVVIFRWANPDPGPNDHYQWQLEGSNKPVIIDDTQVEVPAPDGPMGKCIRVITIRSSVASEEKGGCVK